MAVAGTSSRRKRRFAVAVLLCAVMLSAGAAARWWWPDAPGSSAGSRPPLLARLGMSWWILLAALALLFPMLALLRSRLGRRLSVLHKCLLVSVLLHLVLTAVFSFIVVTKGVVAHLRARPEEKSVAVDVSREADVREQLRQQITNVSAPVPDASAPRTQTAEPAADMPAPKPVQTPLAKVRPAAAPLANPQRSAALTVIEKASPRLAVDAPAPDPKTAPPDKPRVAAPDPKPAAAIPDPRPQPVVAEPRPRPKDVALAEPARHAPDVQTHLPDPRTRPPALVVEDLPRPEIRIEPSVQLAAPAAAGRVTAATQPADVPPVASIPQVLRELAAGSQGQPDVVLDTPRVSAEATSPLPSPAVSLAPLVPDVGDIAPAVPAPVAPSALAGLTVAPPAVAAGSGPPSPQPQPGVENIAPAEGPRAIGSKVETISVQGRSSVESASLPTTSPSGVVGTGLPESVSLEAGALAAAAEPLEPTVAVSPLAGPLGPQKFASVDELENRPAENRQPLLEQLGGTKQSEEAVVRALEFLSRNQEPDGRWTWLRKSRGSKSTTDKNDTGLTGLALMCFLASDHTPAKDGPYRKAVAAGLDQLLARQKGDGDLRGKGDMYSHAIATVAMAEAAHMTKDERYRTAALKAAEFIVRAQHPAGGWRYTPGEAGDTSVLGWQVMALHAAERLGFEIPEKTRGGALSYLDKIGGGRHRMLVGYQSNDATPAMTAEAMFSRLMLGQKLTGEEVAEASASVTAELPSRARRENFYQWYYTSLALMQVQNDAWKKWNSDCRDRLVTLQQKDGDLAGSWDLSDRWSETGGRVYTTALATLTLQVYYRYAVNPPASIPSDAPTR